MPRNFISIGRVSESQQKKCEHYKLYHGRDGKPFPDALPRFVVFMDGVLVCEEKTERDAKKKFLDGAVDGFLKKDYLGLDEIMRR